MRAKPARWIGSTLEDLRVFPWNAKRGIGYQPWQVRQGLDPEDGKPMPSSRPGAQEIRVRTGLEHRVIHMTKFSEAVYVLHRFQQLSRKTRRKDLDLAKARFEQLIRARKVAS